MKGTFVHAADRPFNQRQQTTEIKIYFMQLAYYRAVGPLFTRILP